MLLFAARGRVVDADLGRVGVEHPPDDGTVEDLSDGLGGFEAVAAGEVHPPLGDFLRGQFADAAIAEHGDRFAE